MEYYKVLVVDDEEIVLEGLTCYVDWEAHGFRLVGTASSSARAMHLMELLKPDLIITDISMPGEDGLRMMERIQAEKEDAPRFIILSGYDRFEYVKRSIHLRAEAYLLKPIDEEEIYAQLERLKPELDKQACRREKAQETERKLKSLLSGYLQKALSDFLTEEEDFKLNLLLELEQYPYGIVYLLSCPGESGAAEMEEEIYAFFKERKKEFARYRVFTLAPNSVLALDNLYDPTRRGYEECAEVLQEVLLKTHPRVIAAISDPFSKGGAARAFAQCMKRKDQAFYRCYSRILSGTGEGENVVGLPYCPNRIYQLGEKYLCGSQVSKEKAEKGEDSFEKALYLELKASGASPDAVRQFGVECLEKLHASLPEGSLERERAEEAVERIRDIGRFMVLEEIVEYLASVRVDCAREISGEEEGIRQRMEEYIRKHYREDLKLSDLAETFHYNENYTGKLFRHLFDMSFRTYLNAFRLEEAKRQLIKSAKSLSEIALLTGFGSMEYFCRKFREKEKMTPAEYRKQGDKKSAYETVDQ